MLFSKILNRGLILLVVLLVSSAVCWAKKKDEQGAKPKKLSKTIVQVGTIQDPRLKECSGFAASRNYTNVFWANTDGGKAPVLFALSRSGATLGAFPVRANLDDWEEIAVGEDRDLYIADTGNNDLKRKALIIHRIPEPDPKGAPQVLVPNRTWVLKLPSARMDCESFFVHGGKGYVISKVFDGKKAEIYSFDLTNSAPQIILQTMGTLPITDPVTSAAVSADSMQLALLTHSSLQLMQLSNSFPRLEV